MMVIKLKRENKKRINVLMNVVPIKDRTKH